eukprot:scaffold32142_cov80-Skeletonema_marinoi.AAC.1
MMSSDLEAAAMMCCASCGVAEVDEIKLRTCTACKSVRYCGVKCQRDHRPKHTKTCKKRAAELRDEVLFRQPESSHLGDCPICCLPLPIVKNKSTLYSCCSKRLCNGCEHANWLREIEGRLEEKCPFCRHPVPETDQEADINIMKRVAANDPVAMQEMGMERYQEGDYESSFEYLTKAAGLGFVAAHYNLSILYRKGKGVEKDEKKELYHLEEAAIGGHLDARYNLGCHEERKEKIERAVKHWIITANLGCDYSIQALKDFYADGLVSKEDFAAALRAHQAAVIAMKSPQREAAEAAQEEAATESS